MTGAERGFLLLSSCLGNPERRPLTVAQLRELAHRVREGERLPSDRELDREALQVLGYGGDLAERILGLLSEEELLDRYLRRGESKGCVPLTRVTAAYPPRLRGRLGLDSPGCLWAKGDLSLLEKPCVSLVGSRDLRRENRAFAEEVGLQAAKQGFVLVSGNARGADRTAQESCLAAGGQVICVVADELYRQEHREGILYLSEEGWDQPFSAQRALSRNRVIHGMGLCAFVAQCSMGTGGTWSGTRMNLRYGWSPVFCFADGSDAVRELEMLGAEPVEKAQLQGILDLVDTDGNLFDQTWTY